MKKIFKTFLASAAALIVGLFGFGGIHAEVANADEASYTSADILNSSGWKFKENASSYLMNSTLSVTFKDVATSSEYTIACTSPGPTNRAFTISEKTSSEIIVSATYTTSDTLIVYSVGNAETIKDLIIVNYTDKGYPASTNDSTNSFLATFEKAPVIEEEEPAAENTEKKKIDIFKKIPMIVGGCGVVALVCCGVSILHKKH